ncbi:Ankyrin repeat containing protein [Colletotrichum higginsianum IMI 349063]|uniref:Ankyrin repeat containing protein n=2 Tax=Colletotrichum higginsianum (strain IMI 349063) TaxID=759273 RepID=A0A1B7XS37_COLHI|nr:Ankyrin repeat containing protein [Colletotrichum higginsianum IMI 349063]OBR02534.1 Ankyrin repeat containing protein [Colletotrichum higginsianum IMI 349063]
MPIPPTDDDRQRRIIQFAEEWGLEPPPSPSPLTRPESPPSFRTSEDDFKAEELLKRKQMSHGRTESTTNLRRAFTSKKKTWDYKLVFDALDKHVADCGSPGVAEALIALLVSSGGDFNMAQKAKTSILPRRKSLDSFGERSKLLQHAIHNGQTDMIRVLLPHADAFALDASLPLAMHSENVEVVELLLRYGAGVARSSEAQDAFRQACALGGQAQLVGTVLRSDGRPPTAWLSQCMVDATKAGCLETVLQLSRSHADGDYNQAEALKVAIGQGRHDIALAIIMGNHPPKRPGLDEAFSQLLDHPSMNPRDKLAVAELLLCAGTDGDAPAMALIHAAAAEFHDMVGLLVSYGVSIEYQDAMAIRKAIQNGRVDVAYTILSGTSELSATHASECVELIPKNMAVESRRLLLDLLLRRGASGTALHDMLIEAAEAGDLESAKLLLTPVYPGGRPISEHDVKKGPRSMVYDRHQTASVDHKGGLALQIAVMRSDVPMTKEMLMSKPSSETLAQIFPLTKTLSRQNRYRMVECFLTSGLAGAIVHDALQEAIDEEPPLRDEELIGLFLRYDTDINTNEGSALVAAVAQKDVRLLNALLKKNVTPQTAASVLPRIIGTQDAKARLDMATLLLASVPDLDSSKVSQALLNALNYRPADLKLLQVLLVHKADVNVDNGIVMASAIHSHDPPVLETLLTHGKPTPATVSRAINEFGQLIFSDTKTEKLQILLQKTRDKTPFNDVLVKEVHALLQTLPEHRQLSIVRILLGAGADVNSHNAAALCHAVAASDTQITDLLFAARPSPASLASALPHALRIADPMDRLEFSQKLLDAGAPSAEANRALGFAINTYTEDIPLLRTLSAKADTSDGEALVAAVKKERPDIVQLVLQRKHPVPMLNNAFAEAALLSNREARASICEVLLHHGASGSVLSDALLAAAADGDLVLGNLLVSNGAQIDEEAIVEACRSGAADVLNMLLSGGTTPKKSTIEKGFQAATEVGNLKTRAAILEPLLVFGVDGEALHAQLASSVRFGEDGDDLVKILLEAGADPNHNKGEAIWAATRSAYLGSLKMMLGLADSGTRLVSTPSSNGSPVGTNKKKQHKPSPSTLNRALRAAWKLGREARSATIDMLFRAGLPVSDDLHVVLNNAVNEEEIDLKIIRQLLRYGASPIANDCQTLVDATRRALVKPLAFMLESKILSEDLNLAIREGFTTENTDQWFTEAGFSILHSFLQKGAHGDGLSSVLTQVVDLPLSESEPDNLALANGFVDVLLDHKVDVNYAEGKLLQTAAAACNSFLVKRLLEKKPNTESISRSFYRIFDNPASEDEALELINMFTEYADGETRLDVIYTPPESIPLLFLAVQQHPRSIRVIKALLDAGYYYDQMMPYKVMEDLEEEPVTLMMWALLQPQKKVSSGIIQMLIETGAKVNFESRISQSTPLMLAIRNRRPDVVKMLLLEGAEVDVCDVKGNTPLTLSTEIGGDTAIKMMSNLLAAGASRNDGSLHNSARELNLAACQVLVQYGHEPDFPSTLHEGRSALGELCRHCADSGELTAARQKLMERVINFLIEAGSDITLRSEGKSVLLLALESRDPVVTSRTLLKAGMWKHINKKFNHFSDGKMTYSPTMYVTHVLPKSDHKEALIKLLRANRADDVYYANMGPQPEGAVGMPEDVEMQERNRRARLDRINLEQEDHVLSIARNQELATVQAQIWSTQAELEDSRRKRVQQDELVALNERARAEEDLFAAAMRRKRNERSADLEHQAALTEASITRARALELAESEVTMARQGMMLEWEKQMATEKVDHAKALSAIRVAEREDVDRMDRDQEERFRARLAEQRRLVDGQNQLASQLAGAGVNGRRQVGYITGEIN